MDRTAMVTAQALFAMMEIDGLPLVHLYVGGRTVLGTEGASGTGVGHTKIFIAFGHTPDFPSPP
jgi:hypothetical protein